MHSIGNIVSTSVVLSIFSFAQIGYSEEHAKKKSKKPKIPPVESVSADADPASGIPSDATQVPTGNPGAPNVASWLIGIDTSVTPSVPYSNSASSLQIGLVTGNGKYVGGGKIAVQSGISEVTHERMFMNGKLNIGLSGELRRDILTASLTSGDVSLDIRNNKDTPEVGARVAIQLSPGLWAGVGSGWCKTFKKVEYKFVIKGSPETFVETSQRDLADLNFGIQYQGYPFQGAVEVLTQQSNTLPETTIKVPMRYGVAGGLFADIEITNYSKEDKDSNKKKSGFAYKIGGGVQKTESAYSGGVEIDSRKTSVKEGEDKSDKTTIEIESAFGKRIGSQFRLGAAYVIYKTSYADGYNYNINEAVVLAGFSRVN